MSNETPHLEELITLNRALFGSHDNRRDLALADRQAYLTANPEAQAVFGSAMMTVLRERHAERAEVPADE